MADIDLRQTINKRWEAMMAEMEESWRPHWEDITNHILPRRGKWKGDLPNRGDKQNGSIVDSSAGFALRVLIAGMTAGLTSPNWPWFKLKLANVKRTFGPSQRWLAEVQTRMYDVFARSNFYRVSPTIYAEMASVATSAQIINQDNERVIDCLQYTIGTYALAADPQGRINTLARKADRTVDQLVSEFGIENVTDKIKSKWEGGDLDDWVEVRHMIEPNDIRIDSDAAEGMPWRSFWWEKDSSDDEWLRQSGYRVFPVQAPRWETRAESIYGTDCPGMMVLPDVKQLQLMVKRKSEAVEKQIRPPLAIPSNMRGTAVSLAPAALNYVDQFNVQGAITPIVQVVPPLAEMRIDIGELRQAINRGFFADLFITVINNINQPPQKTATEIASIEGEKLLMLGPVLERVFNDYLDPTITVTYENMKFFGMIPPIPPEMKGQQVEVEFVSTLAQAQKAVGTATIEKGVSFIGNIAALFPEATDVIDVDGTSDKYLSLLGAPPEMVRSIKDRQQRRAERLQMQRNMQGLEAAKTGAEAAKLASDADVGSENLLERVLASGGATV
jgi:hypothetical protein